jgi:PAS domain S-box-containing protein
MNSLFFKGISTTENLWRGTIAMLTGAVLLVTLWCLTHGITVIFMHLYYFPIVLLAYRYRWKGCGLSLLLALGYLGLVILFNTGDEDVILGALYRVLVFVGIAAVIAWLSVRIVQVEDKLTRAQQFQESVIANANIWISVLAPDGNTVLVWNEAAEAISGYKKRDVVEKNTVWKLLYPDRNYRRKITKEIQRIIGQDDFFENFETEIRCADGTVRTMGWNTRALRDAGGTVTRYIAIGHDITDQKLAEEALRESEEKFRGIFDQINDGIHIHEIGPDGKPGKFIDVNAVACRMLQYTREELMGHGPLDFVTGYHSRPVEEIFRVLLSDSHAIFETEHRRKDGTIIPVEINSHVVSLQERQVVVAVVRDITERKHEEAVLRESKQILEGILNAIPARVFWKDKKLTYLGCNTPFARDAGFEKPEDIIGRDDYSMGWRDQAELYRADDREVIESRKPKYMIEEPQTTPTGETIYLLTSKMPLLDARGDAIGVLGIYLDNTERKRAEEAIRESRQLFADIIRFLPDSTFVIDSNGTVLAWNCALEQLSGVQAADIIGKGDYEYSLWPYGERRPILIDLVLHPEQDVARMAYASFHQEGRTITAQTEIIQPGSGHKISLFLVASPLIDSQGKITGAIESMRDISRLKEAEAELVRINQNLDAIVRDRTRALEEEISQRVRAEENVQEALRYTRSVIEANPDLMVVLDIQGIVLDVNAAAEKLTGIPRDQLIGTQYFRYLLNDGMNASGLPALPEQGRIEKIIQLNRNDGQITTLAVNTTLIEGSNGSATRIIASGHDITRQKQDEESIRASLDEKVVLLREVHHRVKNNLQIIISLVNLQMRQTTDPEVKRIMSETQSRVRAMSLVHEKLYQSESLSRIDFADYTRFLVTHLFSFYGIGTRKVRLAMSMEKIMVDINTAVPLGLILNELASNALKHGFPDEREGIISISGKDDGEEIELVVHDDGIGIPADFDWKNTPSLGIRLIIALVGQLNGTIDLSTVEGTTFILKIPHIAGDKTE